MKPIAPKITDHAADFLPTVFPSINAGATYTIDSFPALYQKTLAEIRGKFESNELSLIVDVFKFSSISAAMAGRHLLIQCTDKMEIEGLAKKWDVQGAGFLEKLKTLTVFQSACLEIWASGFWSAKIEYTNKPGEFEKYVEYLL